MTDKARSAASAGLALAALGIVYGDIGTSPLYALKAAVQAAGGTVRNFGEFTQFETKPATATWQQYYCAADGVSIGTRVDVADATS